MRKISVALNKDIELLIRTKAELEEVFMLWKDLEAESNSRNAFISLDYMKPFILDFFNDESLVFIIIIKKGRPIFLTPLISRWSFLHGALVNILRSAINEEIPMFDCLMRKGEDVSEIWGYFIHALFQYFKWDVFVRKHVNIEDEVCNCLYKVALDKKKRILRLGKFSSPFVKIYSKTWDEYILSLSHNARKDFRRKQDKFSALENSRLDVYTRLDNNLERGLDDMFAVADKGWAAKEKTAISSTPVKKEFYAQIAINFASRENLKLYVLKVGDKPVAFMLNIIYKRIVNFLKTAYDPLYAKFSPGTVLIARAIKDSFDMRFDEFNLCGITERYKVRWANAHREVGDVIIFNNTVKGHLAYLQENTVVPYLRKKIYSR